MEEERRAHGGGSALPYEPPADRFDEAFDKASNDAFGRSGSPRAHYARTLERIARDGPVDCLRELRRRVSDEGVVFGERQFDLDPVPRILTAEEWRELEAALTQRARALEAFVDDVYGDQRIVSAGVVPARVIETCSFYEPALRGAPVPGRRLAVCGFDVVRDESGEFLVLEDNVRTPSGIAYALAARELWGAELAEEAGVAIAPITDTPAYLAEALREVAAPGDAGGEAVVLTDGPGGAHYEHARLARSAGAILASPEQLEPAAGGIGIDGARVGVIYRRTDEDRLWEAGSGEPTRLGAILGDAVVAGRVAIANAFGSGVGDDKLTHGYVERMIRFYLSEDPLIASVPSVDLETAGQPAATLAKLDEMVVKVREGEGGRGVAIPEEVDAAGRERLRRTVRESPDELVAQEALALSSAPCVDPDAPGGLAPRLVDLRAFALASPDGFRLAPAALTRFAAPGSAKVNSSAGGGAKDTWVLA